MATSEPSADDIDAVVAICNITKSQALILLNKYQNPDSAINNFFEDPDGSIKEPLPANRWQDADNFPAYRIDADDTPNMPGMSRPPSRVDNRGDFSAAAGVGGQFGQQDDMQDAELQQALAMSAQETGVATTGQHFGPANRVHYDPGQWSMTVTSSSREIVEHPPPAKRRRLSNQPAFLRGSPETGYLAPLLNIYHNIPLAREAFLLPSFKVLTYGYDPTWWMGTSDENTKAVSVQVSENDNRDHHNLLAELQELMAFLDDTQRAYGSVDALADLHVLKRCGANPAAHLVRAWSEIATQHDVGEPLTQVFTSVAVKDSHIEGVPSEKKTFPDLETAVPPFADDLIDLLDSTIWNDTSPIIDDVWLEHCSEIFTVRLHAPQRKTNGIAVNIPAIWYADRYMYNYRDIARQMRLQLVDLHKEIDRCSQVQRRCEVIPGPNKKPINIREVLQAASKVSGTTRDPHVLDSTYSGSDVESQDTSNEKTSDIETQLQTILRRIDEKVKVLEERKLELQHEIKRLSRTLTHPTDDVDQTLQAKYFLQGVSTKPHITYIRRRTENPPTLIDFEDGRDADDEWQWWRLFWNVNESSKFVTGPPTQAQAMQQSTDNNAKTTHGEDQDENEPFSIRKVTEAEVLEAAMTTSDSVLLVYARQSALEITPKPASNVLKKLIEQDNRCFGQELAEEERLRTRRDSLNTNTTIMDDVQLDSDELLQSITREMTPMSTTSPPRGRDGQPSPKRPKGNEEARYDTNADLSDDPPPYEPSRQDIQMQEKSGNKIGLLSDRMLHEVETRASARPEEDNGPIHIEHAHTNLR